MNTQDIKPGLMVHARPEDRPISHDGARGIHLGTVDHLEGQRFIKLRKEDSADGKDHWIPLSWVDDIDDKAVYLNKTIEEFDAFLLDDLPNLLH